MCSQARGARAMERPGPPHWPGIGSLCVLLSAGAAWATPAPHWQLKPEPGLEGPLYESKVTLLLAEEKEKPICFTQRLEDLVCFWEETASPGPRNYSFFYHLEEELWKPCVLKVVWTGRGTVRYTCPFPLSDASSFIPLELKVTATPNGTELRRTIYINEVGMAHGGRPRARKDPIGSPAHSLLLVPGEGRPPSAATNWPFSLPRPSHPRSVPPVFLDPPSGLTVQRTETPSQVALHWLPPPMAQLTKDIHYEVKYWEAAGTSEQRVDVREGRTGCVIASLRGHTRYTFAVRAKMAEPSYSGYWSSWSQPATVLIAGELDPLILGMSAILTAILLLLVLGGLLSQRRFLKQMLWPGVPSPEHGFQDLFTIHRGNFQLWLEESNACLWWGPLGAYLEKPPARLEVLSEHCRAAPAEPAREEEPLLGPEARWLAQGAKDDYLVLDTKLLPHSPAAGPPGRGPLGLRASAGRALEAQGEPAGEAGARPGASGLEPEQEERASASNFEYTVLDAGSQLLCPRVSPPAPPPSPPDLKYLYLVVSDSGISADYSSEASQGAPGSSPEGPYTNLYENSLLQPSPEPLPPSYVTCS
ncbi:erythropoietin receptor isoform X1 [Antechinus flavipes]|uniref:erythropoietin receptor isoform X1 n=1 Tax=Antechinus flavipes TaxID=38775 RepID=UPI0022357777|nr:erythropoietin receptor isoform X1 [Antechinus flavipes]